MQFRCGCVSIFTAAFENAQRLVCRRYHQHGVTDPPETAWGTGRGHRDAAWLLAAAGTVDNGDRGHSRPEGRGTGSQARNWGPGNPQAASHSTAPSRSGQRWAPGSPDASPASPEGPSAARRRLPPSRARSGARGEGKALPTRDLAPGPVAAQAPQADSLTPFTGDTQGPPGPAACRARVPEACLTL